MAECIKWIGYVRFLIYGEKKIKKNPAKTIFFMERKSEKETCLVFLFFYLWRKNEKENLLKNIFLFFLFMKRENVKETCLN
jgi:hypothetical protein